MNVVISTLTAAHGAMVLAFQKGALLELHESPLRASFAKELSFLPMSFDDGAVGKGDIELEPDDGQGLFPSVPM